MKNYTIVLRGYRFLMIIIAFMNFLIFLNILPSNIFYILILISVIASCGLSLFIKKNKKYINYSNTNDRKIDAIITIIWLISLFTGMPR